MRRNFVARGARFDRDNLRRRRTVTGIIIGAAVILILICAAVILVPRFMNDGTKLYFPKPYEEIVTEKAQQFSVDKNLIYAVMKAESSFDPEAQSHAGAKGLMQLTQETFEWVSSQYPPDSDDIFDPETNIHCAAALLKILTTYYGSLHTALCAYNAGMGNVSAWLSNPEFSPDGMEIVTIPFPETEKYVERVMRYYETYNELYGN